MDKIYKDAAEVKNLFADFWRELLEKTPLAEKLKEKSLSVKFILKDYPEASTYIAGEGFVIGEEANDRNAVVILTLSGEMAHKFWLKKILLPLALAKGEIKTKGPFNRVLELMPMLKPGYDLYSKCCDKYNISIS